MLGIWPPPATWTATDGHCPTTSEPDAIAIDSALGPQAYRLQLAPSGIEAAAGDEDGARYARITLAQLRRAHPDGIPAGLIEDQPVNFRRGVLLDISRDRVPSMAQLRRIVADLAGLKCTHLQLYTEHTFAYAGHATVHEAASPITPAELRELDHLCRSHGLVLVANQNCLGHVERWLRHRPYADWAELTGDALAERLAETEVRCLSLAPVRPESAGLVRDLLKQQLACVSSSIVNINCDEAMELGEGQSAAAVAETSRGQVYGRFVGDLAQWCLDQGWQPQFWGDIALAEPDCLALIPTGCEALAWGYEVDADFVRWGAALTAGGRAWWACPGTSSWRSLVGRRDARRGSVARAVTAGADGVLITDWGDCGHRQPWGVSWLGLAEGLGAAWAGRGVTDDDLVAIGQQAYRDQAAAEVFAALSAIEAPVLGTVPNPWQPDKRLINNGLAFTDSQMAWDDHHDWQPEVWAGIEDAARALMPMAEGLGTSWSVEAVSACAALMFCARRARVRRGQLEDPELADLGRRVLQLHETCWQRDSRPGGWDDSARRWQRLIDEVETRQETADA